MAWHWLCTCSKCMPLHGNLGNQLQQREMLRTIRCCCHALGDSTVLHAHFVVLHFSCTLWNCIKGTELLWRRYNTCMEFPFLIEFFDIWNAVYGYFIHVMISTSNRMFITEKKYFIKLVLVMKVNLVLLFKVNVLSINAV